MQDTSDPISRQAQVAMMDRRLHEREMSMGVGNLRLNEALHDALASISPIVEHNVASKEARVGRYANLPAIIQHVQKALRDEKIRWRWGVERTYSADDAGSKTRMMTMYCDLIHWPSGEVERTLYEVPIPRLDPQGVASAFTYGRRYSLLGAIGFATSDDPADDDGQRAMPQDMDDHRPDSPTLAKLKAELDKITEATGLIEWKRSDKAKAAYRGLSDAEVERLKQHYNEREAALIGEAAE